jgi:hypothetical protein
VIARAQLSTRPLEQVAQELNRVLRTVLAGT